MYELASVVVPVYRQADHVGVLLSRYGEALAKLPVPSELVVVVNGPDDGTYDAAVAATAGLDGAVVTRSRAGWGEAVQHGLREATGDLLCFTNSARTAPEALNLCLLYAVSYPGVAIKAQRRTRDNWRRRLGSVLYNLQCRSLFDLAVYDVNGTPKVFPREFSELLDLRRHDDLIDAEFVAVCRRFGYPILEVPVISTQRHGGSSTTGYASAFRMYRGALALRRELDARIGRRSALTP